MTCTSFSKVIGCESCTSGCQCDNNLVLNGHGKCVLPSECECSYVEKSVLKTVSAGKRIMRDCNECTCRSGKLHCTTRICKVDGEWTDWAEWSQCRAAPCLLGYQWRSRACTGTQNGGRGCSGVKTQQKQCRNHCPGEWAEWTNCSADCGIGYRKRTKHWPTCEVKNNCPVERKPCQGKELVCAIKWTDWSNWTKCIGGCGTEGQQYRSRHCHGTNCVERNKIDARSCAALCPGAVSEWSKWGQCSRECDLGVKMRSRTCSSELCHEELKEIEPCMTKSCLNNSTDGNDTTATFCPGQMIYSKCISACTKRSCSDLSNEMPLSMCEKCIPGCLCPEGTIEEKGKCIKVKDCECTDSTERQWAPDSSWIIKANTCTQCKCSDGEISCNSMNCDLLDGCTYSDWTPWTACNSTCLASTSKVFRFRQPLSGIHCTDTTQMDNCAIELPECSAICQQFENGYTYNKNNCTQCECAGGAELCTDICKEMWHEWSSWSQCPICGRNATHQRYRACEGSNCRDKTEIEKAPCLIPDCHDDFGCRVNTQLRNFTRNDCSTDNVVVNYCAGR